MLASVYALTLAGLVLTVTITPASGEYLKGMRRARREGRRRPGAWSDAGSNRVGLLILCTLILAAASAVVHVVGRPRLLLDAGTSHFYGMMGPVSPELLNDDLWLASRQALMSRPIVIAVLTVAYFGFAYQYFLLRSRRLGMVFVALFLMLVWLAPLGVAAVVGLNQSIEPERILPILALSPAAGIALSSGIGQPPGVDAIQSAALVPAVTLAFLFKYLLIQLQRRIDRTLPAEEALRGPDPFAELEARNALAKVGDDGDVVQSVSP